MNICSDQIQRNSVEEEKPTHSIRFNGERYLSRFLLTKQKFAIQMEEKFETHDIWNWKTSAHPQKDMTWMKFILP